MTDRSAAERARMACRIYLKLYEAGPKGAPVTKDDAIGPGGDPSVDLDAAMAVVARFVDDTILDEHSHASGEPHYALTAGMRARMEAGGVGRVRSALAGEAPGDLLGLEAEIRTGRADARPL